MEILRISQTIDAFYTCVYLTDLNREGFWGNLDCKNSALIHMQINAMYMIYLLKRAMTTRSSQLAF